ncbi:MAG: winged helix-turn-helix domain-containing protein [Solirubrobacterales bacterium]
MAKKLKGEQGSEFIDSTLVSAASHPIRTHCLMALFERTASPSELAEELDLPIQNVSYHIRELEKLGFIELVRIERRRSTEHFYRLTKRHFFDADTWETIGPVERSKLTAALLRQIGDDISKALAAGTIDDDDNHISRTPMKVDRKGWNEVVEELGGTLDRILEIQARCAERRTAGESDPDDSIPVKVEIIQFRSPTRI